MSLQYPEYNMNTTVKKPKCRQLEVRHLNSVQSTHIPHEALKDDADKPSLVLQTTCEPMAVTQLMQNNFASNFSSANLLVRLLL